jgi:uncharacterized membrane protein YgdD (TMEM256/DUF423 family)
VRRDPLIICAALSAAVAIMAGAFGAHGANEQAAAWLRTGSAYQLSHAIAAIVVLHLDRRVSWAMLAGAAIFAGTLYAIAIGAPRWFGAITPVGGATLIGAWLWLAFSRAR